MDCFVTTARKSFFATNSAAEPRDPFLRLFRRVFVFSSSVSSTQFQEPLEAALGKRPRAAMAFLLGCCLCGKARVREGKDEERTGHCPFQGTEEEGPHMEGAKKKRKLSRINWNEEDMVEVQILHRAPARLKRLLRRVRGKLTKLRHFQQSTSFHYDPLSYAMNFDDGCWQYNDSHVKLHWRSPSPHCRNGNFEDKPQNGASACPLWQRRHVPRPKALKVNKVGPI